jgi:hypothetical protein
VAAGDWLSERSSHQTLAALAHPEIQAGRRRSTVPVGVIDAR